MAERHGEMTSRLTIAAGLAALLLGAAIAAGFVPVVALGLQSAAHTDAYLWRVARFTLVQAGLSTVLSLLLGIPLALALARQQFPGRRFVLRLLALPNGLPAIVGVLGLVAIFGQQGWLGGWINLYGLTGILIAHVFFNFPLAARAGLAALQAVPPESYRLAAQLGFARRDLWWQVDRPALLAAMPGAALLIFLLCAASFTIVLTLGGGPNATTLDVAIYQALRFDFDPARATLLALVQAAICAVLVLAAQAFPASLTVQPQLRQAQARPDAAHARLRDLAVIAVALLLLVPPLVSIIVSGIAGLTFTTDVLRAALTSLALGTGTAVLSLMLCWPLAQAAARSRLMRRAAQPLVLASLILPPAVMATGWFLLAARGGHVAALAPLMVLALNALMALPFSYTLLAPAVAQFVAAHDRLCASLGLEGAARLLFIDIPVLRKPLGLAFLMAAVVSLGDMTAITLFGSGGFMTLPGLLYQQMGSYRMAGAGGTALLLMLLALALITLASRWSDTRD